MKKLKSLFKTKKGIAILLSILLILIIAIITIGFILNKDDKGSKKLKEDTYTMYVKINPLVKITFGENYYICSENKTEKVCSDKTSEVTDYVLVNDDAKEIYGDIDLKGLSLIDALAKIYDTARDKEIDFDTVEIIANYEFDSENLEDEIGKKSKYKVSFNVITTYDKELKEDDVINEIEKSDYYTVAFDSNGGSKVESVKVKEGYGFTEPKAPTRNGYNFIEWQLDGKKYNFEAKITKDITLKAKWEKVKEDNKKEETGTANKPTENNKPRETDNNANKINLNNNVMVIEYTEEHLNKGCWFYMFVTNLKELFPNADISGSGPYSVSYWGGADATETEISGVALTDNFNSLKFDTASESQLLNLLEKYKNGYKGVSEVEYTNDNHKINYRYKYIKFVDDSYEQVGKKADEAITNALKGATRFNGPCGFAEENKEVKLTEEICDKYNLVCERW